jgi:serine/alanine adding enzyme
MVVTSYAETSDWDAFVEAHPRGTIFHTRAMIRAFAATPLHSPHAFAALDEEGNIAALVSAVHIATLGGRLPAWTARSIFFVEPLWRDDSKGREGVRRLLERHEAEMRGRSVFAEARPFFDAADDFDPYLEQGYTRLGYWNILNRLDGTEDELFARLDKKCRQNIQASRKLGVTIKEVEATANLTTFYRLVSTSYAKARVPLAGIELFRAAFHELPGRAYRMLIAELNGEPVAAGCFLNFKDRVYAWYVGTRRLPGLTPMAGLFWEAIRTARAEGFGIFDFAGAGWEGEEYGPGRFKAKFGGEKINFGRYRRFYSPWRFRMAEMAYGCLRGFLAPGSK